MRCPASSGRARADTTTTITTLRERIAISIRERIALYSDEIQFHRDETQCKAQALETETGGAQLTHCRAANSAAPAAHALRTPRRHNVSPVVDSSPKWSARIRRISSSSALHPLTAAEVLNPYHSSVL